MIVSASGRWCDGKPRDTFFPLPDFFFVVTALNPFTSASKTIEGGLSFFDHAATVGSSVNTDEVATGTASIFREGGAEMTAVAETVANEAALGATNVVNAPTGKRAVAGFGFCGGFRRLGANAKAADQPTNKSAVETPIGYSDHVLALTRSSF